MSVIKKEKEGYAEITVKCPECNQKITIKVSLTYRDVATRFPFEYVYVHGNPPHGLTLYLDKDMQVRGTELLRNIDFTAFEIYATKEFPKKIAELPAMAISLGMVTKKEAKVLELCNGVNSIFDISKQMGLSIDEVNKIIKRLKEKELVKT